MKLCLTIVFCFAVMPLEASEPPFTARLETRHSFQTTDKELQRLHDEAERKLLDNLVQFTPSMKVLVEGGGYPNAWIETQPMGGEMYARRDAQTALNNQLIFMLTPRDDGRLPGMVIAGDTARKNGWHEDPPEAHVWFPEAEILADYEMLQGFCFPEPAWRMYHWIGKDKRYLGKLRDVLAAYDAWLWRTRDSNGDGILETWCVWDTGEDESTRLTTRWAPNRWPFDQPPGAEGMPDPRDPAALRQYWHRRGPGPEPDEVRVPFASMDIMAYSYSARATLAKISAELGDGRAGEWRNRAEEVRRHLFDKLWDPQRHACFDLDRDGKRLPELIHNNLRCMWYGIFTQQMANAFVDEHLLNPDAFWTPVPLVSIAIHEPLFRNGLRNNWSGQPQGLTYQRAIGALENYGRFAEVTRLGRKLLPVLIRNDCKFTQQLDPHTGAPSGQKPDGYGPMMLAALEYISRMHGIHLAVVDGRVWWSAVDATDFTTSQVWGDHEFRLESKDGTARAIIGGKPVFAITTGTRVVTDLAGKPLEIVGISPDTHKVTLTTETGARDYTVAPNEVIRIESNH
ncbi:MAG TPA: trehalase family glycosidase [Luteolibacter sp.]|nr:trehalase family glycosidase [Luteolibacter sp.]